MAPPSPDFVAESGAPRVVAIVPARAGSKRVPGKSRRRVGGRTLVDRAVDAALSATTVSSVVVTTDDPAIACRPSDPGVLVLDRPPELATDEAASLDVVRDVLSRIDRVDIAVLVQPTAPFRIGTDIDACVQLVLDDPTGAPVVTVVEVEHPIEWTFEFENERLVPLAGWAGLPHRSQESATRFRLNGAVYAAGSAFLASGNGFLGPSTRAVVMPAARSLDIDTEFDLELAECMVERGRATLGSQVPK